jgi:hypothetical protein
MKRHRKQYERSYEGFRNAWQGPDNELRSSGEQCLTKIEVHRNNDPKNRKDLPWAMHQGGPKTTKNDDNTR